MDEADEESLAKVRRWRWPDGVRCPRCRSPRWSVHARTGRPKYRCADCLRTFNDLTGTPFARSHLPLEKWFECARRMDQGRATCAELSRRLGVKVATAWRMRRILRRSFSAADLRVLAGEEGS